MSDPVVTAPDGAFTVGGGGWEQDVTEASVNSLFAVPFFGSDTNESLLESQLLKLPLDALKSFMPMIPGATETDFASVGSAVTSILGSLAEGANTVLTNLRAAVNQLLDILRGLVVTPINEAVAGVKDWFDGLGIDLGNKADAADLAELQSRTDELEGVIGYGHGYCNAGLSLAIGAIKYGVDVQVGPAEGVSMTDGAWVLNSKGLWVADARVTFDPAGVGVGEDTEIKIRVFEPDGDLHFEATNVNRGAQRQTLTLHVPFTVPTAGYRVELWVAAAALRNVGSGSYFNGLSVEKRSTETS